MKLVWGQLLMLIRENITPRGDGNEYQYLINIKNCYVYYIRENITPRGDGNLKTYIDV